MALGPTTEISLILKVLGEGLGTLVTAADGLKKIVDLGVEYNAEAETSKIGITGLVASLTQLKNAQGNVIEGQNAFNAASEIASDQLKKLQVDSLKTTATFPQLRDAFQAAIAPGVEAGLTLDQIRKLTTEIALAAGAIGLPMEQVAQETGAILRGEIDINARLATSLGISNDMVNNWKAQGTLATELGKRLEGFAMMGDAASQSWSGVKSNLEDLMGTLAGLSTKDYFSNLKESLAKALSGAVNTATGEIDSDLKEVVGRFNDILGVIGQELGDVIVFVADKTKEFGKFLSENKDTVDEMTGSFNQVWESVKLVVKALLEIPSLDNKKESVDLLGKSFGEVAVIIAAVADNITALNMGLKYIGASANEFLGDMYDAYVAVDKFTGNLKQAAIDKEIADSFHKSAQSMKKDADEIFDRFDKGETNVAKVNDQLRNLANLGKESTTSTKVGIEAATKALDSFVESSRGAITGVVDLNKIAKEASGTLETLYSKGEISRKDYEDGIAKINERLKQFGIEATIAVKPIEDINKALASVDKKPIESLNQALEILHINTKSDDLINFARAVAKVDEEFAKGKATLDQVNAAWLVYAEAKVKVALEAGKEIDADIRAQASKRGLTNALNELILSHKKLNPEVEARIQQLERKAKLEQEDADLTKRIIDAQKLVIQSELDLAIARGDSSAVHQLQLDLDDKDIVLQAQLNTAYVRRLTNELALAEARRDEVVNLLKKNQATLEELDIANKNVKATQELLNATKGLNVEFKEHAVTIHEASIEIGKVTDGTIKLVDQHVKLGKSTADVIKVTGEAREKSQLWYDSLIKTTDGTIKLGDGLDAVEVAISKTIDPIQEYDRLIKAANDNSGNWSKGLELTDVKMMGLRDSVTATAEKLAYLKRVQDTIPDAEKKIEEATIANQRAVKLYNDALDANIIKQQNKLDAVSRNAEIARTSIDLQIQQIESEKKLAEIKGDVVAATKAENDISDLRIERAYQEVTSQQKKIDQYKELMLAVKEKLEADGELSDADKNQLQVMKDTLTTMEQRKVALAQDADSLREVTAASKDAAIAAKELAAAQAKAKEEAAQLAVKGEVITGIYAGWKKELTALSDATYNNFLRLTGATSGFLKSTEDTADKLKIVDDQLTAINHNMASDGIAKWASNLAYAALESEKAFLGQADVFDRLISRLKESEDSTNRNAGNLSNLIREAEGAKNGLDLLDRARLDQLNQAIDTARNKMEALRDASLSALEAAERALLQEKGDQKALLALDMDQKRLELQNKINEAKRLGDLETITNLQKALDMEEQLYNIKLKKLNTTNSSSNTTNSSSNTTNSSSNTTSANVTNINITSDASGLVTEDFWRKKVMPIYDKVIKYKS